MAGAIRHTLPRRVAPVTLLILAGAATAQAQQPVALHPSVAAVATRAPSPKPVALPETVEPSQVYLAVPLDEAGRLGEALPLYQARAERTQTEADRLRYAGALLRAGQREDGVRVLDTILAEHPAGAHGQASSAPLLCASTLLLQGFPALAVERLRPVYRARPTDRRLGLLLARALAAAGDQASARTVLGEIGTGLDAWDGSELVELARGHVLAGDPGPARALLGRELAESVLQMMRDSILANVRLLDDDWSGAARLLAEGKRKGPPALDEDRVNRAWRNVQRELRSMQLRLALAVWRQGRTDLAVQEATRAAGSDEEHVRSSAILLVAAGDLVDGRRDAAMRRLTMLGGHDRRFQDGVASLERDITDGRDATAAVQTIEQVLASEDRSAGAVTRTVIAILRDAAGGDAVRPQLTAADVGTASLCAISGPSDPISSPRPSRPPQP